MISGSSDEAKSPKLTAKLGQIFNLDRAGNHTRVEVFLTDDTGKVHKRIGDGRQIGNFHPIFIQWKGEKVLLEKLIYESNKEA
jgi:hypothetical protein